GITTITMGNYTRVPIALLVWTGWVQKENRSNIYQPQTPFLVLTEQGQTVLNSLSMYRDIRLSEINQLNQPVKDAIIRLSFYKMLERPGFDIKPVNYQI